MDESFSCWKWRNAVCLWVSFTIIVTTTYFQLYSEQNGWQIFRPSTFLKMLFRGLKACFPKILFIKVSNFFHIWKYLNFVQKNLSLAEKTFQWNNIILYAIYNLQQICHIFQIRKKLFFFKNFQQFYLKKLPYVLEKITISVAFYANFALIAQNPATLIFCRNRAIGK